MSAKANAKTSRLATPKKPPADDAAQRENRIAGETDHETGSAIQVAASISTRAKLDAKIAAVQLDPSVAEALAMARAAISRRDTEIAGYQRQIDELEATSGASELARRKREVEAHTAAVAAAKRELADLEAERLACFDAAQEGAKQFTEAVQNILLIAHRQRQIGFSLTPGGRGALPDLGERELIARLSAGLAAALSRMNGVPAADPTLNGKYVGPTSKTQFISRFGGIEWSKAASDRYAPGASWRNHEESLITRSITDIIEGKKDNAA